MKDKESRIMFKDGELVLVSKQKPIIQVRQEMIVLRMVVGVN